MTIKVGDEVEVFWQHTNDWSKNTYTVLYVQDCDTFCKNSRTRKWAVVAYKSDIPQVFKLDEVRKPTITKSVIKRGVMDQHGSVYINGLELVKDDKRVEVHCTEVDGKVDLSYPYTVKELF